MNNEGSKDKKNKIAGFTSLDNRLMAKQDITIQQKVLLSQVVSMMNSTGRFNASNDYISATTGFNKKTISKAFKVFSERGWLQHKVVPGGGRWVLFNEKHKANLEKYLGTVEEHKEFLKSLRKEYNLGDFDVPNQEEGNQATFSAEESTNQDSIESKEKQPTSDSPENNNYDTLPTDEDLEHHSVDNGMDSKLSFGKPNTIEYCFMGKWWPIIRPLEDQVETLQRHIDGITPDVIRKVCEDEPVSIDLAGFDFRYLQRESA